MNETQKNHYMWFMLGLTLLLVALAASLYFRPELLGYAVVNETNRMVFSHFSAILLCIACMSFLSFLWMFCDYATPAFQKLFGGTGRVPRIDEEGRYGHYEN